jgi:streptomycin 6-kinase
MLAMILPSQLVVNCQRTLERKIWLNTLPQLLDKMISLWSLHLEKPFDDFGTCSWVCPVIRSDGSQAVLKLAMPHMEGKHEIQGLRYWSGRSTVKLLEADEDSGATVGAMSARNDSSFRNRASTGCDHRWRA